MDKELGFKKYEYMSRYANVPVLLNDIGEKYHGNVMWTKEGLPYTLYDVKQGDTLEKIASVVYGNPTLYWVIADVNRIIDPFEPLLIGRKLMIVSLTAVDYGKRF